MLTKILVFTLLLFSNVVFAIKIPHNAKSIPNDIANDLSKVKTQVVAKNKSKIFDISISNHILFDKNLMVSEAFLIRPFEGVKGVHIASNPENIFKPCQCKILFSDSYTKELSPDLKVLTLYQYNNDKKIHAFVGKARMGDRHEYITDLSGDGLINFKIHNSIDDEEIVKCKKRLANERTYSQRYYRKKQVYKKGDEVYLSAKFDDLVNHVITPKLFPADQIIVNKNTIELVHLKGNCRQDKERHLAELLKKNYTQEEHHRHVLILNDNNKISYIPALKSKQVTIDSGFLLEAEKWYRNTTRMVINELIGNVYSKWL